MSFSKFWAIVSLVAIMVFGGMQSTSYSLIIGLSDGSNTVSVQDNASGDSNSALGAVTFIGSIGDWVINVSTGISKPALGSETAPSLDLNSVNLTTSSGGTLTISMTDSGFTGPASGIYTFTAGGTTIGIISLSTLGDINAALGPFSASPMGSPTGFSGTATGSFSATPSQLGIQAEITHLAAGATSFDAALTAVPIPAAAWLLGSGLVGLVAVRRRLRKN